MEVSSVQRSAGVTVVGARGATSSAVAADSQESDEGSDTDYAVAVLNHAMHQGCVVERNISTASCASGSRRKCCCMHSRRRPPK